MPSLTDCWGIEVGSNAIKALRLLRRGDAIEVGEFDVLPFKKVLTTPELDVDEAIRVGLDQLLSRHNFSKSTVAVSVPGHLAFARFAKLPPVEPKKIPDIVKFEAVQQIPFPIEQVEWDYQTFQDEDSPDVEVGIFAITKDRVLPWLRNFQQVGLPVNGISLSPVAVFNALNYDLDLHAEPKGTILMDIGTLATDLIITDRGRIWSRTIPMGGNHFTDALVRSFKLSFTKAEKLKREASSSKYARQIFQAMRPVFVDLVQEVQKSLGYYQSLNRDVELDKLIGLGSTFRLPGLQTFLKQQLQIEVQRLDAFRKIEVEGREAATFAENTLTLAPAYGLAIQGLEQESVSCNLLPATVTHRQVWRAKQPLFAAAAVLMILAAGIAGVQSWLVGQSLNSPDNLLKRDQVSAILQREQGIVQKWRKTEQQSDLRPQIRQINRLLTYRDVWSNVLGDIDRAMSKLGTQQPLLPNPNGEILWEEYKKVPRSQRRQIFIEQISTRYELVTPDGLLPYPIAKDKVSKPFEDFVPSYEVVLIGTTPLQQPNDFLYQTFIATLQGNNPANGRPYEVKAVELKNVALIGASEAPTGQPPSHGGVIVPGGMGRRGGFDPYANNARPGAFQGGAQGQAAPRVIIPGLTPAEPEQPDTDTTADSKEIEVIPLLPPSQLAEEDTSTDSRFEIRWRLVLRKPDSMGQVSGPRSETESEPSALEAPATPDATGATEST